MASINGADIVMLAGVLRRLRANPGHHDGDWEREILTTPRVCNELIHAMYHAAS